MILKTILEQLNLKAQCGKYSIPLRQCPQFLFVIMGFVIMLSSIFSYAVGNRYVDDPQMVAFGVLVVSGFLFALGYTITQGFEKLAEANRLKTEFISIVSHQLRTPLTNLRWSMDMLMSGKLDHVTPTPKQQEYFKIITDNTSRMNELVQDLLMVSRIEQGRLPVKPQEVFLPDFIKDVLVRFYPSAESLGVKVELKTNPDVSDIPKIAADISHLKIVVENFIENAIRYSKNGGKVDILISRKNKSLHFSITDEGIGIPQKDQKFVSQKFFRSDVARVKQPSGTGLGLYMTKMIIKGLGGEIGFTSQENKGSTFWFTLPIKS